MQSFRACCVTLAFILFTVPLMPVQWLFLVSKSRYRVSFPHWYHKNLCKILGIKVCVHGDFDAQAPTLLISNHTSWLDITVLSSILPVSFVAKKEVASWPFFGWLAKLQRTVFVDRQRRLSSKNATNEISIRLLAGDRVVLFAEGTSNDGNLILPFKTALFAAVEVGSLHKDSQLNQREDISVQTISVAYRKRHGMPLGRRNRPIVAWYGDMDLLSHMWGVFKYGPYDVEVHLGEPVSISSIQNRKELAKSSERNIQHNLSNLLYPR